MIGLQYDDDLLIDEPELVFTVSTEYNTEIVINLPNDEALLILVIPDFERPTIKWRIKEV